MLRLIVFLLATVALATGLSWLADRPGLIVVNWEGYEVEITVFHAVVAVAVLLGFAVFAWSLLRQIWLSPAALGGYFNKRRQKRGLEALSSGIIAIGAGDRTSATRYAIQARKSLPHEPLTQLLRAQAAQLSGDRATARRIYEGMLAAPDTEVLGLRGLFLEAQHEGEKEAARQFAERAVRLNPALGWPVEALFDIQCRDADWAGALETLAIARKHGHVEKASADRRRAVLLTAQAQCAEDSDPERALALALEAHGLANDLVPAAAIAGRILSSRGNTPKATKVLQRTWLRAPHPDLATAYAYARLGDSPHDRLDRVKQLASLAPNVIESPIAVARAAIEARDFAEARKALEPLLEGRMTQRVATLMARIEGEEHGDKGRVREWLARAVNAPRDPAWTADGIVADQWAPVSPVTGALDAFQWRVPVESLEKSDADLIAEKLEELVALGAPAKDITPPAVVKPAAAPTRPGEPRAEPATAAAVVHAAPQPAQPAAASATPSAPTASPPATPPAAAASTATVVPIAPEATVSADRATSAPAAVPSGAEPSPAPTTAVVRLPVGETAGAAVGAQIKPQVRGPDVAGIPAAVGSVATDKGGATKEAEARKGGAPVLIAPEQHKGEPESPKTASRTAEPVIFVSPRAPDDPGPEQVGVAQEDMPQPRTANLRSS